MQREELLTGLDYSALGGGFGGDDQIRRLAWERHRDELLAYWTGTAAAGEYRGDLGEPRPGGPGTRPWAWWTYDAPEEERRITGEGEPVPGAPLAFGVPTQWLRLDLDDRPVPEAEQTYLERHGLLEDFDAEPPSPVRVLWSDLPGGEVVDYCRAVLHGDRVAGKRARQAADRFARDLRDGAARGLYWDDGRARHVLRFFDFLKQSIGEWEGKPLLLFPWQVFFVGQLFGWCRVGLRRFRTAFLLVARKAGKSTVLAGIANYMFSAVGEAGAQIYIAAVDEEQARIIHAEAEASVRSSPVLSRIVKTLRQRMEIRERRAVLRPLAAGAPKINGFNPLIGIADEYHEHPTDAVVNLLKTGMGARSEPLIVMISTAGDEELSPCYQEYQYAERVLEGIVDDEVADTYLTVIYELDEGDDYRARETWAKANPSYPTTPKPAYLEEIVRTAEARPELQGDFLRYTFNRWNFSGLGRLLDFQAWKECAGAAGELALRKELEGQECIAGLDLASRKDLAALALYFLASNTVLVWYWLPEEGLAGRAKRERVPYVRWAKDGWIEASGQLIQFAQIQAKVEELSTRYRIREICFDSWNAHEIVTNLVAAGHTMVQIGRGFKDLSPAAKHLEALVIERKLRHGNHPVTNWCASNVRAESSIRKTKRQKHQGDVDQVTDGADIRPVRGKGPRKIDGIMALVLALARVIRVEKPKRSVYEDRGFLRVRV